MSRRLRAIGFGEIWDKEGALHSLRLIAERAERRSRTWTTAVAPGIEAVLEVDEDLSPSALIVRLHGQRQPLLVEEIEPPFLSGFTSLDGCPITPIRAAIQGETPDIEPRTLVAVEYAGFCDGVEPIEDRPYGMEVDGDETRISGVLLRTAEVTNQITQEKAALSSLWLPGAVIPFCCRQADLPPPGTEVSVAMDLYVEFYQRL